MQLGISLPTEEAQTRVARLYLKSLWHGQYNSTGDIKRNEMERWEDNIKDWTRMELEDSVRYWKTPYTVEMHC